jgi:hypothetical protein
MKIAKKHSHLNGEEWLLVHEREAYQEVIDVIKAIDAEKCRTKISKEKTKKGKALYSNVGIEILPTKAMQRNMSSGIAYYEGELHNILRHGRSNPPIPLVIIGLEP